MLLSVLARIRCHLTPPAGMAPGYAPAGGAVKEPVGPPPTLPLAPRRPSCWNSWSDAEVPFAAALDGGLMDRWLVEVFELFGWLVIILISGLAGYFVRLRISKFKTLWQVLVTTVTFLILVVVWIKTYHMLGIR